MLPIWIALTVSALIVLAGFVSGKIAARLERRQRTARGVELAQHYHLTD